MPVPRMLPRRSTSLALALLAASTLGTTTAGAPQRPAALVYGTSPASRCTEDRDRAAATRAAARPAGGAATLAYPRFDWPLEITLRGALLVVNYFDHDPTAGVADHMGLDHTYDGHTGTDLQLYSFRDMDRGVRVLAAAPGTVIAVEDSTASDRNCTFDWPDFGQWVTIDHGDGTQATYLHLRAHSIAVNVGDVVARGQMLGLVGSSGHATGPHLHFEPGDVLSGPYAPRDPWAGPANPLPGLWAAQEAYVGTAPMRFFDLGVFTEAAEGGSVFNTTYCDIMDHIPQPAVLGADETRLCMWFQFQGDVGDPYHVEVRRPDGSVYGAWDDTLRAKARYDWFWAYFFWNPYVAPADYGTWTVRATAGGQTAVRPFTVGASTAYGARFWPRAGRSFRIGAVQRDTLRHHPLGGPVTYALVGAPATVTLADSVLTVGATSGQTTRSAWFQVVMTDAAARRDTAWYHLVDFSKPAEPPLGAPSTPAVAALRLEAWPNPARGATALAFALPRAGRVQLDVLDAQGRLVRRLVEDGARAAGSYHARWDGRDERGLPARSGVYFVRLIAGDTRVARRIVLSR